MQIITKRLVLGALLAGALSLGWMVPAARPAAADTAPPTSGLQLCEHIYYQGQCVNPTRGDYGRLDTYPFFWPSNFNDRASSLRIAPGEIAAVYEHGYFQGRCLTVRENVEDLRAYGFNDLISSVMVGRGCSAPPPAQGLQLCWNINYEGACQTFTTSDPDLRSTASSLTFSDTASSLRVASGWTAAVYEHINYQGRCQTVTGGTAIADLRGTYIGNDTISSIRVGARCS